MARNPKLHEVLAFEADVKNKSKALVAETANTFTKKTSLFAGMTKTYESIIEGGDEVPAEINNLDTTVLDKMNYVTKSLVEAINVTLSKEETNGSGTAQASLIIGDLDLGVLTATSLLSLENTLKRLRNELYLHIPTLEPGRAWIKNPELACTFNTEPTVKFRTATATRPIVSVQATENFPAQVHMENFTQQIGKYSTIEFSGRIRPISKSAIIERLDTAIYAVKSARARANNVEAIPVNIGGALLEYIHGSDLT